MLTEYNGNVFNAEMAGDLVRIWKFVPVAGFTKKTDENGITYYENYALKNMTKRFFDVSFFAIKGSEVLKVKSLEMNDVCVEDGNKEFKKPLTYFEYFQMVKVTADEKKERITHNLIWINFVKSWNKYVVGMTK